MKAQFNEFAKVFTSHNLYMHGHMYFRLFAKGITPNGCWLIAPYLQQLCDIEGSTRIDIYGRVKVEFDVCGTVPACNEFIKY